jgi:hypothetical protein
MSPARFSCLSAAIIMPAEEKFERSSMNFLLACRVFGFREGDVNAGVDFEVSRFSLWINASVAR